MIKNKILEKIKQELDLRYDIKNSRLSYNKPMLEGMIYAYEDLYRYIKNLEE